MEGAIPCGIRVYTDTELSQVSLSKQKKENGGRSMDAEMWTLIGIICAVVVLLVYIGDRLEERWRQKHPPDDWDGMREERFDDDDDQ